MSVTVISPDLLATDAKLVRKLLQRLCLLIHYMKLYIDINECDSDPCVNGGRCIDDVNSFRCDCSNTGYFGVYCEQAIDECLNLPCQNGGLCVDDISTFTCNCTGTGYTGQYCERRVDGLINNRYMGVYVGRFEPVFGVSGDVYVMDDKRFFINDFNYDGSAGTDLVMWVGYGDSPQAGSQGLQALDDNGMTKPIEKTENKDMILYLPGSTTMCGVRYLAVLDLVSQAEYSRVRLPPTFSPPAPYVITVRGEGSKYGVKSGAIIVLNEKTVRISKFQYPGSQRESYFLIGTGDQPSIINGTRGSTDPLRDYDGKSAVTLILPDEMTVFAVDWLAVHGPGDGQNYGHIRIPTSSLLNLPSSVVEL